MRVTEKKHETPFWIVWCPKPQHTHRCETEGEANAQAEKLAKDEGETFYVLKAVGAVGHQIVDHTTRTFFQDPLT